MGDNILVGECVQIFHKTNNDPEHWETKTGTVVAVVGGEVPYIIYLDVEGTLQRAPIGQAGYEIKTSYMPAMRFVKLSKGSYLRCDAIEHICLDDGGKPHVWVGGDEYGDLTGKYAEVLLDWAEQNSIYVEGES